jgi:hypothetical protein
MLTHRKRKLSEYLPVSLSIPGITVLKPADHFKIKEVKGAYFAGGIKGSSWSDRDLLPF